MASVNGASQFASTSSSSAATASSSQLPSAGVNSATGVNALGQQQQQPATQFPTTPNVILSRKCLQDLVKQVDPNEQLDEDVEDLLLGYADEFFEQIVEGACAIASHRKATAVEVKDLQTYLERSSGIWVPGFGSEESKPFKRPPQTEAHKQRMALIKKQLKKY